MDERSSLGTVSKRGCFFRNARARNTHVEENLNHPFAAQADDAPVRETFRAFEAWIYSGNGFSQERYAKLKLERPDPPDRLVDGDDDRDAGVEAAVGHGLEQLRAREGLDHAPGAIVNPDAYRDGGIANPN